MFLFIQIVWDQIVSSLQTEGISPKDGSIGHVFRRTCSKCKSHAETEQRSLYCRRLNTTTEMNFRQSLIYHSSASPVEYNINSASSDLEQHLLNVAQIYQIKLYLCCSCNQLQLHVSWPNTLSFNSLQLKNELDLLMHFRSLHSIANGFNESQCCKM